MSPSVRLRVLGAGAVTSVGNSLPATAAAFRAGLNNFRETLFDDARGEPVVGAQLELGQGPGGMPIAGAAKLAASLTWAIEEAVHSAGVALPLPAHVPLLFLGDETRPAPLVDAAHLCYSACASLFSAPEQVHLQAFTGGEVACVDALLAAREFLAKGAPFVLIAAADSWLRVDDIEHALQLGRLLDGESGAGFIPGEGAAAVLIGAGSGDAPLCIEGLGLAEEAATLLGELPCYGKGLAQAMRAALQEARWQAHEVDLRISDAAGEPYFAEELSYAWSRLLRAPSPRGYASVFPAISTGHVGCSFGPLMLALAWQLARRRRLPGSRLLLQLSSSHRLRGAIAARAGDP